MSGMTRGEKNLPVGIACAILLLGVVLVVRKAVSERTARVTHQQRIDELSQEQEVFDQGETATINSDGAEHYLSFEGSLDVRVLSCSVFLTSDALEASLTERGLSPESYGVDEGLDPASRFALVSLALDNESARDPNAVSEGCLRASAFLFDFDAQEEVPYSHVDLLLGVYPGVSGRDENRAFLWDSFELPVGGGLTLELLYELPSSCGEIDWESLTLSLGNTPNDNGEAARWVFRLSPSVTTE